MPVPASPLRLATAGTDRGPQSPNAAAFGVIYDTIQTVLHLVED